MTSPPAASASAGRFCHVSVGRYHAWAHVEPTVDREIHFQVCIVYLPDSPQLSGWLGLDGSCSSHSGGSATARRAWAWRAGRSGHWTSFCVYVRVLRSGAASTSSTETFGEWTDRSWTTPRLSVGPLRRLAQLLDSVEPRRRSSRSLPRCTCPSHAGASVGSPRRMAARREHSNRSPRPHRGLAGGRRAPPRRQQATRHSRPARARTRAHVATDALIEALWPEKAPGRPRRRSGLRLDLRKALGQDTIVTDAGGSGSKSLRTRSTVRSSSGARRRAEAPPAERAAKLVPALALWRGPASPSSSMSRGRSRDSAARGVSSRRPRSAYRSRSRVGRDTELVGESKTRRRTPAARASAVSSCSRSTAPAVRPRHSRPSPLPDGARRGARDRPRPELQDCTDRS